MAPRRGGAEAASLLLVMVLVQSSAAHATVRGPCEVSVGENSITAGHDTPATALRLGPDNDVEIVGQVGTTSAPGVVREVRYEIPFLGGVIRTSQLSSGADWSSNLPTGGLTWASLGLFLVRFEAGTSRGICTGEFYLCLTGNPLTTVVGAVSVVLMLAGGALVVRSIARNRRPTGRPQFVAPFVGQAMLILGVGLILQQACYSEIGLFQAIGLPLLGGVVLTGVLGLVRVRRTREEMERTRARR